MRVFCGPVWNWLAIFVRKRPLFTLGSLFLTDGSVYSVIGVVLLSPAIMVSPTVLLESLSADVDRRRLPCRQALQIDNSCNHHCNSPVFYSHLDE